MDADKDVKGCDSEARRKVVVLVKAVETLALVSVGVVAMRGVIYIHRGRVVFLQVAHFAYFRDPMRTARCARISYNSVHALHTAHKCCRCAPKCNQ